MTEQDDQFKQAVVAFKDGRRDEARNLLMDIVDKDERHEQAWLYLSALVETVEEQQICLENVLEINPNNDRARKGLEKVKQQIAARAQDETPATDKSPEASMLPDMPDDDASPFSTLDWDSMPIANAGTGAETFPSQPIGAEFGASSGDALVGGDAPTGFPSPDSLSAVDAAAGDSLAWLNDDQPMFSTPDQSAKSPGALDNDLFASATSVDWGAVDGHVAPGSGKNIEMPSTQEYDDWVQNLNIKSDDEPAAPQGELAANGLAAPFTDDAPGPFGGTDYMLGDETLGDTDPQAPAAEAKSGAFGGDVFGLDAEPAWAGSSTDFSDGELDDKIAAASGDSLYEEIPGATDDVVGARSGSLFDDDYAASDDDFGGAAVYEPDDALFGADADDGDDLDFSFDEDDDSFFDEEPAKSAAEKKSDKRDKKAKQQKKPKQRKTTPTIDPAHARYYALIPAEIEAKGGDSGGGGMVLGILIMLALNAVGYATYFLELI